MSQTSGIRTQLTVTVTNLNMINITKMYAAKLCLETGIQPNISICRLEYETSPRSKVFSLDFLTKDIVVIFF